VQFTSKFEFGDVVKDKLTPFKGSVVGITFWQYGCARVLIQGAELKDSKPVEVVSMDEQQLDLVESVKTAKKEETKPEKAAMTAGPGGPYPEPTRR